ncbi:MAG: uracil-DNA glycosylase [Nitrococcus mobilis]|nr:uracil-DNA glycosylase [Nitrococcus mobilis]
MAQTQTFDIDCTACPRLASFLRELRALYPAYHARPVPAFGPLDARLLIVGLAPGKHGANATGRPFTGDHAGVLLYQTLFDTGFSNQPRADRPDDGLELYDCRVTNAVRCLPPANKPSAIEVNNCSRFLGYDLAAIPAGGIVLALGRIAHEAVVRCEGHRLRDYPFAHRARHRLSRRRTLLDSYHCSRYNTQTGRLTAAMFHDVLCDARALLSAAKA